MPRTSVAARPARRPAPSPKDSVAAGESGASRLRVAVVGAGMAGVACARTLLQAGHEVHLFEKSRGVGGRMAMRRSEFGGFDHGAQYFTVRDARFARALLTAQDVVRPWAVSTVRVLDELGHVLASAPPPKEPHFVAKPGMNALVTHWTQPLLHPELFGGLPASAALETRVAQIERDALHPGQWQLRLEGGDGGQQVSGGFDRVVIATPHPQAHDLLLASGLAPQLRQALTEVHVAPCWTLMLAFPNAMQPGLSHLGPQWNAARSTHHRISWLAREGSKPGRDAIERWTVQAAPDWSAKHLEDDPERVKGKLLRGFAEITGIRATPTHAVVHRWRFAQTQTPLGRSHLFDPALGLGLCGDWCLGHRVEDAFISGLELALEMVA
ncbi:MAG TPA: FAD-dependent oxidoreductase [Hydrogenophaga sp.]|uniref:NAD(P)/FAD-dependent oxidoreductase n=1 Tax=Hydrogenophaga sp. TaxID=1904254 RepID=UPI002CFE607F|nr:FAD-dependent oxidoreductase [Hydrogenophaga sp.]HMN93933.1 FAD-dependent oxidoreductase [Hydrogenophaga sp.]HMP10754.1 FAD-dependent oxidoreductase [Hydrogenophaga sp.]